MGGGGEVAVVNGDKNVSCPKQGSETLRILSCKQGRDSWCQRQTPVQLSLKYHPEDFTSRGKLRGREICHYGI